MRWLLWLLPVVLLASEPPQQNRPAAGESVIDPVFGSKIIRISSASEGAVCTHNYSTWSPVNSNNTRLLMMCWDDINWSNPTEWMVILNADGTPASKTNITALLLKLGNGVEWDRSDPDKLYHIHSSLNKIYVYDFGESTDTLVKDLSGLTSYINRFTMSDDGDIFSVQKQDGSFNVTGHIVWKKSTDTVLVNKTVDDAKMILANDGAYVQGNYGSSQNCWIKTSDAAESCCAYGDSTCRFQGHGDQGTSNYIHWEGWDSRIIKHTAPNTATYDVLFSFGYWGFEFHGSITTTAADKFVVGTSRSCPVGESFPNYSNEIFTVPVAGGDPTRLAHARSDPCNGSTQIYWQTVRPAWSQDGRFIAFTSNWYPEANWQTTADLYLIDLDPPTGGGSMNSLTGAMTITGAGSWP